MICFRIDYWNASATGSEFFFETTRQKAMAHIADPRELHVEETKGIEHITVTEFIADSCDMEGWSNHNDLTDVIQYFKY